GSRITTHNLDYLFYQKNVDTLITIADYNTLTHVRVKDSRTLVGYPLLGSLYWGELSDRRLFYIHTEHDRTTEENNSSYTFTIMSLDNLNKETITQKYIPVEYPESLRNNEDYFSSFGSEEVGKKYRELWGNIEFYPPIFSIVSDGNYIFVYTFKENEQKQRLVNIIDTVSKKQVGSAYFPFFMLLSNGYAYTFRKNSEGFFVIRKYRINPEVYGK
ncbi:hypothetical protein ACFL7D_07650, partial [candidate division KSB1 bacterium]